MAPALSPESVFSPRVCISLSARPSGSSGEHAEGAGRKVLCSRIPCNLGGRPLNIGRIRAPKSVPKRGLGPSEPSSQGLSPSDAPPGWGEGHGNGTQAGWSPGPASLKALSQEIRRQRWGTTLPHPSVPLRPPRQEGCPSLAGFPPRLLPGRKGVPLPASTMQGREGAGQVLQSAAPAPVRDGAINDRVGDRSPAAAVFRNLP